MNDKLQLFFEAINNYDLYGNKKLIKYATKIFLEEDVDSNFLKFSIPTNFL